MILTRIKIVFPFYIISITIAITYDLPTTLFFILTKLLDVFNITITFVQIWRLPRSRDLGRACHFPPDSLVNLIALGGAIGRVKGLLYLAPNAKKVLIGYSLKIIGLSPIHSCIFMLSCGG